MGANVSLVVSELRKRGEKGRFVRIRWRGGESERFPRYASPLLRCPSNRAHIKVAPFAPFLICQNHGGFDLTVGNRPVFSQQSILLLRGN